MMTTDGDWPRLTLLTTADLERIKGERARPGASPPTTDGEQSLLPLPDGSALICPPTGFGFVEPRPPYEAKPRPLPGWARRLPHLRPLKLVE